MGVVVAVVVVGLVVVEQVGCAIVVDPMDVFEVSRVLYIHFYMHQ